VKFQRRQIINDTTWLCTSLTNRRNTLPVYVLCFMHCLVIETRLPLLRCSTNALLPIITGVLFYGIPIKAPPNTSKSPLPIIVLLLLLCLMISPTQLPPRLKGFRGEVIVSDRSLWIPPGKLLRCLTCARLN
jgi:hypothetical protein